MRKVVLALLAVAALATVANADSLSLFYDARSSAAAIVTPAPPYTNNASLCGYAYYGIGQNYPPTPPYSPPVPLPNGGGRGDGQMIWVSPKIGDLVDYYGNLAPDSVPDEQCVFDPGVDYSLNSFYLYAELTGQAGSVVSSIGVNQSIPGAFAGPSFYLRSATTTLLNAAALWSPSGTAVAGSNASTSLMAVQVPVRTSTTGQPEFNPTVGIRANQPLPVAIAKVDIVGECRPVGTATVGIYNVNLAQNSLLVTSCGATAPPALTTYFGYDWATGLPDPGTAPDMVIYVVCKGDFDLNGTGAASLDNNAYYDISAFATPTNFNPFELWLGDFDGNGQPCQSIDNIDYFRCANIPAPAAGQCP